MIKPDTHTCADVQELSQACAEHLAGILAAAISGRNAATFVLAGGNTPRSVYQSLASEPYRRTVQLSR